MPCNSKNINGIIVNKVLKLELMWHCGEQAAAAIGNTEQFHT